MNWNWPTFKTEEVRYSDEKLPYDACRMDTTLEQAKLDYPHIEYIGSSKVIYCNGVRNEWDKEIHFFKNKTEK